MVLDSSTLESPVGPMDFQHCIHHTSSHINTLLITFSGDNLSQEGNQQSPTQTLGLDSPGLICIVHLLVCCTSLSIVIPTYEAIIEYSFSAVAAQGFVKAAAVNMNNSNASMVATQGFADAAAENANNSNASMVAAQGFAVVATESANNSKNMSTS